MKSLWTPVTRWTSVTEEGLAGGPVIPDDYDGSPHSVQQVYANILKSGEIGQIVAADGKSTIISVPLISIDPETHKALDYGQFSDYLEKIRKKYETGGIKIRIIGFAKVAGDLITGLRWFVLFFALAIVVDGLLVQWYIRCWRSTALMLFCSFLAVVWQLGMVRFLGYELDPYSVLVPFLIFSIGMSHGAQKMNGIMQDIGRGTHKVVAARYTFRRLFMAGMTALLADAVGFAVLMLIKIQVIQDLAITASIGVAILIFTNLMLLPILLSYTGVNTKAALRSLETEKLEKSSTKKSPVWGFLDHFTTKKWAAGAIMVCVVMTVFALISRENLKIGDLDPGAPELRQDSRYNKDNAYIVKNYAASSDVMVVMVKTPPMEGALYKNQIAMSALENELRQVQGVESTNSLAALSKNAVVGLSEGNLKWYELIRNQSILNAVVSNAPRDLFNDDVSMLPLFIFLKDHKADTLTRVVSKVEDFAKVNNSSSQKFLLAAGNAGIEAATNIVVKKAMHDMLFWIYGAVALLCLIAFRSWKAVIIAIIPLGVTSMLCEALMAWLGIGVKVATLPVIALGVGIGVDYALYILSVMLARLREGKNLSEAYFSTLCFTGRVVILVGLTLAVGVASWVFSPIKFQADMGILLVFMFIWNMVGAMIMLPALAYFVPLVKGNEKDKSVIEART